MTAQVKAACELLGLDPLYLANEGKLAAVCRAEAAESLLDAMRGHPLGADSRIIGEVSQTISVSWRWMRSWVAGGSSIGLPATLCHASAEGSGEGMLGGVTGA